MDVVGNIKRVKWEAVIWEEIVVLVLMVVVVDEIPNVSIA